MLVNGEKAPLTKLIGLKIGMPEQNAYIVLNVRKGSSEQEIKGAYIEMVKRFDPEIHTERFMSIQSAYEKLRDPKKRAREDVFTFNPPQGDFIFTAEEEDEETQDAISARLHQTRESLERDPSDAAGKSALITLHMKDSFLQTRKRMWSEAAKDWEEILKLDATNQRAKSNLIYSYDYLGYYYALHDLTDEAIELWEKSLQMMPEKVDIIHNLALAADKTGNREKSQRYWTETVKRWKARLDKTPDDEYIRQCIIEVHKHHGGRALESLPTPETKQEAIAQYREILKFNPDDFEARYNIAAALMEEKHYDEAIRELRHLQEKHIRNLDIVNLLGWAYLNSGKFDVAFSTWRRGMSVDPKNHVIKDSIMRARLAVGKKLKEQGLCTQALVHFKELQKMMPNEWELHLQIAETLLKKGDRRNALIEFQRVLELDPKNKDAKRAISEIKLRSA